MSTPLNITAILDGSTITDLSGARQTAATRVFFLTVASAGLLDLWSFTPIGPRDQFIQVATIEGIPAAGSASIGIQFPSGDTVLLPLSFSAPVAGFMTATATNILVPQGCRLAVRADDGVIPVLAQARLWIYGVNDKNYSLLACCHSFAPSITNVGIRFFQPTVQDLETLTTADGVRAGSLGVVTNTGNTYRSTFADASGSMWAPASGVFDAQDFGAVGDNVTDDTANLQAWLDHMDTYRAAFGGGAMGFLSPGDYRISSGLTVGGETTIEGAGPLVSRLRASGAFAVLTATGVTQVELRHFGIEGSGQSVVGGIGVELDNTSQSVLEGLDVRTIETGVRIGNGSENCRVVRCWAAATETAFEASGASNATHFFQCRSVNANTVGFLLDTVSQCTISESEAEGMTAGEIGMRVAATTGDAIANVLSAVRLEGIGGAGTGVVVDGPGANTVFYTTVIDPYWTNLATPMTDGGQDTRLVKRGRYVNPLIAGDVIQAPGDDLGRMRYHVEGASPSAEPKCFNPVQHDISTGVDGAPVILRRNIVYLHCGANNGVTAATPHYLAWQGETGSPSFAGARSQMRMSRAGRIISASIVSNANIGDTLLEVFANGVGPAVASGTQTIGAGAANGATYELSSDPADQHWAAGDTLTLAVTPANTVGAVVMVEIVAEYDMRPAL